MRNLLLAVAAVFALAMPTVKAEAHPALAVFCLHHAMAPACGAGSMAFGATAGSAMLAGSFLALGLSVELANYNGVDFPLCSNTIRPNMKAGILPVATCEWKYPQSSNLLGKRPGQM